MSSLIGKRIECVLDTAHGDKTPFICDVKAGRREGEVFLQPLGEFPPGAKGYQPLGDLYVRRVVDPAESLPANVTQLPAPIPSTLRPDGPTTEEAEKMLAEIRRLQAALAEAHQQNDKLQAALDARPVVASPVPTPVVEGEAPPAGELQLEPAAPAAPVDELTDERRLSETPVSADTRRRRGRGTAPDHGSNAETADAYQEKQ